MKSLYQTDYLPDAKYSTSNKRCAFHYLPPFSHGRTPHGAILQYAVELHPFVAVAFTAEAGTEPIVSETVEIVTAYASGPRPKSFMPPDYAVHDALAQSIARGPGLVA